MKAIILAAGRGSRMKSLTDERPKCLLEVRGKALIDWQLEALRNAGLREIAIVTGYKRELLNGRGLVEFYNPRWSDTNMVSSLSYADDWLSNDDCIVSYSDIFYDSSAVTSLILSDSKLTITYDPEWLILWKKRFDDPLSDAETFQLNRQGFVLEIGNKPKTLDEIQGQYMGLLKFTPDSWKEIEQIRSKLSKEVSDRMHMTATLQKVIKAKRIPVFAVPYSGKWGEIDNADDLAACTF